MTDDQRHFWFELIANLDRGIPMSIHMMKIITMPEYQQLPMEGRIDIGILVMGYLNKWKE